MVLDPNKVINGTFGEVWLDGDFMQEVFGLEAKVELQKEEIPLVGSVATHHKYMGYNGTGTIRFHKVSSRIGQKIGESIKRGVNPSFEILSSLDDPAAYGAERILIKGVTFDDLTLANWEAKAKGEIEAPFTFTDWEYLDEIDA